MEENTNTDFKGSSEENSSDPIFIQNKFNALFHDEKSCEAKKCLKTLLKHSVVESDSDSKSHYYYYQACLYYKEKNYKKAHKILGELLDQETKSITERNIAVRIVNIIILVELNKINEAYDALESFRKYIERNCKEFKLSKRDTLIVKLLKELEKTGFEYSSDNTLISTMVEKLSEKNTDISWNSNSSELIPFHNWISSKKRNK